MKKLLFIIALFLLGVQVFPQNEKLNIVVIGAHPDDCDSDAGGTAIKYAQLGHNVLFVSLTNGDAGHFEKGGGALAKIRRAEAEEAGKRFGVTYIVLDNHDGELIPDLNIRLDLIRLIRKWNADIVIGPRPNDYHPDHRNTSILMQDAAYMVIVPNIAPDTPPLKKNPVFLYSQDNFKKPTPFECDITVDITDVFDLKIYAMAAHESQFFEWLPWTNGTLDKVPDDEKERLVWLANWRKGRVSDEMRKSLAKWYGESKAEKVKYAESFEICEYGRQPSDKEIKELFPMLGN
ncbi:MAG: PIG-L family deacetylase [Prolixibacteraceae bacterium]|nr:PIG-L family deacetylase [Prolixibacteraceae bacterium]MBN2775166.1 PIG-L family deacetylase [Prolixibacteraceae bacterium]